MDSIFCDTRARAGADQKYTGCSKARQLRRSSSSSTSTSDSTNISSSTCCCCFCFYCSWSCSCSCSCSVSSTSSSSCYFHPYWAGLAGASVSSSRATEHVRRTNSLPFNTESLKSAQEDLRAKRSSRQIAEVFRQRKQKRTKRHGCGGRLKKPSVSSERRASRPKAGEPKRKKGRRLLLLSRMLENKKKN